MIKLLLAFILTTCNICAWGQSSPVYRVRTQQELAHERDSIFAAQMAIQHLRTRRQDSINKIAVRVRTKQDSIYRQSPEYKRQIIAEQAAKRAQDHASAVRAMELNMGLLTPAGQRAMRATPEYKKLMGKGDVGTQVSVCMGSSAYTYHQDIACSGLNHCSAGIKPMTVTQAQKMGRRPCQRCY